MPVLSNARNSSLVAALLILGLSTGNLAAQVLDDFETGSFNIFDTNYASGLQVGLPPAHCIATERFTQLFANGDVSAADLNLGLIDDQVTTVWGDAGGHLQFDYDIPPTDLTIGGLFNAMRVQLTVAVPAGRIEVRLEDVAGNSQLAGQFIVGAANYYLPFTDFPAVDLGNVVHIELHLDAPGAADYHISDFRLWDVPTTAGSADVTIGAVEGPPYPTSAATIVLSSEDAAGSPLPLQELNVSILGASDGSGASMLSMLTFEDSGGPVGMPGEHLFMTATIDPSVISKRPHFTTLDGLRYDFQGLGQYNTVMGINPCVLVHPRMAGASGPTSFAVHFTSYVLNREGNPAFRGVHTMSYELEPDSGLYFTEVDAKMGIEPTPFMDVSFEIFSDGASSSASKQAGVTFTSQSNSAYLDYAVATDVEAWGPRNTISLWAQPSVMDYTTQVWRSRGVDGEVQLALFDLAGRRVRSLVIPASREFTVWDGRDQRGSNVASGVYYMRALNVPTSSAAKIVKLK